MRPGSERALGRRLADRRPEKFGHLLEDPSGGTLSLLLVMFREPFSVLQALLSPPGATLGFVVALTLPLLFIPLLSVDALLLVSAPLFVALVSQGRTALAVTLRYVLALVPGLYLGAVLWWQAHPLAMHQSRLRAVWTGAIALGLVLTIIGNPHRSFSAVIPDSFVPWIHISPNTMLLRREAALKAIAKVPEKASVAADTPLLPLLAQREALIRFPNSVQFIDREGDERSVDYVVTFPGYYSPMSPVFKRERRQQIKIRDEVQELVAAGDYNLIHCEAGALVLRRAQDRVPDQKPTLGTPSRCDALD